ncbi:MAG: YgiQ family radical SAM protein, partial [Candidatus Cloacimonetes bacterium]|nr:YgiQ family radical SAM protein [Candidatus Cloacimonadota bacterium]
MRRKGWKQLDIILISGDAYIDHPSFGSVLIARYLEYNGFKVGIISQPDWRNNRDFLKLGRPKLFFGITSGNMDSMVNHYTAQKKIRSSDAYSPGGKKGLRPNRATIVYTQKVRSLFKGIPIVIGGLEASLRRLPHYDFQSDKLRNSILFDSKADLLVYGMGERTILKIANDLQNGKSIQSLSAIKGTVITSGNYEGGVRLPEYTKFFSKEQFIKMHKIFEDNYRENVIVQKFGSRLLIHNPPAKPLSQNEMDRIYNLPFTRKPHPMYSGNEIPAFKQISNSVTSHRGCFGGCNFCSLAFHQGKTIQSRSADSIKNEIAKISKNKYFKGTISDIGGPTANMFGM